MIDVLDTVFDFEDGRTIPAPSAATSGQRLVLVSDYVAAKISRRNAALPK